MTKTKLKIEGITLIALVVTVVILIILAGITLNLVLGNNGILKRSKDAKTDQEIATEKEQLALAVNDVQSEDMANGGKGSITQEKLQIALNNQLGEGQATVVSAATLAVTYTNSGRIYYVSTTGTVISKKEIDDDPIKNAYWNNYDGTLIIEKESGEVYFNYINTHLNGTGWKQYLYYENLSNSIIISKSGVKSTSFDIFPSSGYLLDNSGRVYTWGSNEYGQLGNGTTTNSSMPICISDISGSALNNKHITTIGGYSSIIALDTGGKVYTWGNNGNGELGNGTITDSDSPICISDIDGNLLKGRIITKIENNGNKCIAQDSGGNKYLWGSELSNTPVLNTDLSAPFNIKELGEDTIITNDNEIYYYYVDMRT